MHIKVMEIKSQFWPGIKVTVTRDFIIVQKRLPAMLITTFCNCLLILFFSALSVY